MSREAVLKEMGLGAHGEAAHPAMLDDSEVHLTAGDVLVQQGTHHAWVNRGGPGPAGSLLS